MPSAPTRFVLLSLAVVTALAAGPLRAADASVDFDRARQLMQKRQSGETLSLDEQAYLQRAIRAKGKQRDGAPAPVSTTPVSDPGVVRALVPLDEMSGPYKGEDGGLYGAGRNLPPEAHRAVYLRESGRIRPLAADGQPAADGKIVLLSLGMSNTTQEFSQFVKAAAADPRKSPQVVVVDGAIGARTATVWAADGADLLPADERLRLEKLLLAMGRKPGPGDTWPTLESRLRANGVSAPQVQALWIKQAEAQPARLGEFPAHARILEENLIGIVQIAKRRFPNLRVVFLSSRIFGGYATTPLNPEPYAYEGAFAMRWLILKQLNGDPRLNCEPARGEVKAPVVVWGPYLWANGATPRRSDGLVWLQDDFTPNDRTHPADSARQKVAGKLLTFFTTDEGARGWFLRGR